MDKNMSWSQLDLIHTSFDHANRCLASTAPTSHAFTSKSMLKSNKSLKEAAEAVHAQQYEAH